MKPTCIALVLASSLFALSGSIFFAHSGGGSTADPDADIDKARNALEIRLAEVLERLERLEGETAAIERRRERTPEDPTSEPPPPVDGAPLVKGPSSARSKEALGALLNGAGTNQLRALVAQVIEDERHERRRAQERRAEEERREWEEMSNGPFGNYNLRVNHLGKRLGLNEFQKQRYFELVADYSGRIEEIRQGLDRENPEVYAAYREKKKQLIDEFGALVIQSLTPPQAQDYQNLSSHDRSPAMEHAAAGGKDGLTPAVEGLKEALLYSLPDGLTVPAPIRAATSARRGGAAVEPARE